MFMLPFALISQIQGDGSLPKTYKTNNNYKTIDTWVFSTPDLVALKQEDDLYDNSGDRPWRFGHNNYTELNLDNCGTWKDLANGDQVWQLSFNLRTSINCKLNIYKHRNS